MSVIKQLNERLNEDVLLAIEEKVGIWNPNYFTHIYDYCVAMISDIEITSIVSIHIKKLITNLLGDDEMEIHWTNVQLHVN
ncbi:hypothetical protein ERW49_18805 [Aliivibrio finisterrensis]|uniref:Uncharacterized protein n=1 Tax=Aliivibrio finisterrensis TaxID=511998 RepID=A0A4Q5K9R4_9GAMM|nr:hypothetical protein [Aliivibrio finisterrensis]RYU41119.1 hypothetical protein ERW49_18805 [Aliivibrio finisterrensis]